MKTKQETFDFVVRHLYKQGKPARENYYCRYRTNDGLMCAVGCLIPDEVYTPKMEGKIAPDLAESLFPNLPQEITYYSDMLDSLQWVHDSWDISESFKSLVRKLKNIAIDHNVVFNNPSLGGADER
jgi:hypothetical protein